MTFWEGEKFKKPEREAFDRRLVAPEWAWYWDAARVALPLWETAGDAFDVKHGLRGVNTGLTHEATKFGVSPVFPGTNDSQLTFANSPIFDLTGDQFTIAILFTPNFAQSDAVTGSLVDNTVGNDNGYRLFFTGSFDDFRFRLPAGGDNQDTTGIEFAAGDLLHIVATFNGTDNLQQLYYKNLSTGHTQIKTRNPASTVVVATGDPLLIGEASSGAAPLDGTIHTVYIGDKFWSAAQVHQHRYDPFGPFRMVEEAEWLAVAAAEAEGRIMASLIGAGGLAGHGGIAGAGGGLAA